MGESKRRKQLDPNYGKIRNYVNVGNDLFNSKNKTCYKENFTIKNYPNKFDIVNNENGLRLAIEYLEEKSLLECGVSFLQLKEAIDINFLLELSGLNYHHYDKTNTFDNARLKVFYACTPMLLNLNKQNPSHAKIIQNDLVEAFKYMHNVDGVKGVLDGLIWAFIPTFYKEVMTDALSEAIDIDDVENYELSLMQFNLVDKDGSITKYVQNLLTDAFIELGE